MDKKGVMIVNLGTPASPEPTDVKAFLAKFLGDKRVIKTRDLIWKPILHGVILRKRPQKSAVLYRQIWTAEGSPLLHYGRLQEQALQERLPDHVVALAMSYSDPTIREVIDRMQAEAVTDLTIIPLYPQYSGTTVGSIFDEVMGCYLKQDHIPTLHFVRSYYDHPLYIDYYAEKIKAALQKKHYDQIVFSYHGIPASYVTDGDQYPEECTSTTAAIMTQVGDYPHRQTYQSKFGKGEWLTPATDDTMKQLSQEGCQKVLILTPGFIADCLETVQEIAQENRDYFLDNGGEVFDVIPPYNGDSELTELLSALAGKT